ncbi:prepilin peptidase [Candidatus Saccharibacteria bacterium]|nr:prepilin peptidase [Candidatus Saccharibacteria bacterium]
MIILIGLFGLALGSFVNALVWRIFMQSQEAKKHQKKSSKKLSSSKVAQIKKASKKYSVLKGRSMCPQCQHQLFSKDLIPIISWLSVRGKCRYCKNKISLQYPVVELTGVALFMATYYLWPYTLVGFKAYEAFVIFLGIITVGLALSVYDLQYMELPTPLVYILGFFGSLFSGSVALGNSEMSVLISSFIGSIGFGGFFYILYRVSNGKWIGGGDVRIGFALGIILGWQKSIVALTLAAYGGTLLIIVLLVIKKYHKKMKIPFGPFLLAATFIVVLVGQPVIDWYLQLSGI